jgi:hypothetical protein
MPFYVGITLIFTPLLQRNYAASSAPGRRRVHADRIDPVDFGRQGLDGGVEHALEVQGQIVQHAAEYRGQALDMQMEAASQSVGLLAGAFMLWYGIPSSGTNSPSGS